MRNSSRRGAEWSSGSHHGLSAAIWAASEALASSDAQWSHPAGCSATSLPVGVRIDDVCAGLDALYAGTGGHSGAPNAAYSRTARSSCNAEVSVPPSCGHRVNCFEWRKSCRVSTHNRRGARVGAYTVLAKLDRSLDCLGPVRAGGVVQRLLLMDPRKSASQFNTRNARVSCSVPREMLPISVCTYAAKRSASTAASSAWSPSHPNCTHAK